MEDFYKVLYSTLKEIGVKVYHEAPEMGAEFPHIIFKVNENARVDSPILLNASIDVFTKEKASDDVERIADEVNLLLDRKTFERYEKYMRFIRTSRNTLGDPDPAIKRVELAYQLRVYQK